MKQSLLVLVCLLVLPSASQVQWIKTLGSDETELINDIATDNAGNVYITGNFEDTLDFDPGPGTYKLWGGMSGSDAFLAKYNSAGALIWAKGFGDTTHLDHGDRIAFDNSGNVYLTGYFRNHVDFDPGPGTTTLNSTFFSSTPSRDVFVSKFDSSGNFLWVRAVGGGTFDASRDVAVDQNGDVYVAGSFQWTADLDPTAGSYTVTSAGSYDPFIVKLNSSGSFVWARRFGGSDNDQLNAIALDAAGNLYVTGRFEGTADLDPGIGTFTITSNGNSDGFVSKISPSGNLIWAKRIGGTNNDVIERIEIDSGCNLYLAGDFQSNVDFDMGAGTYTLNSLGTDIFINKTDSAGNFLWVKQVGNMNLSGANLWGFDRDLSGNFFLSGGFLNTVDLDPGPGTFTVSTSLPGGRMFICKLDNAGAFQWGGAFGRLVASSGSGGYPYGLGADNSGNVYVGGWFNGTCDLDPSAVTSTFTSSDWSIFFLKIGTNCLDAPLAPVLTLGPLDICSGASAQTYSIESIPGATAYTWLLPSGWTGTSTTNSISLSPSASGVFSVSGSNACGTGSFSTYSVTVNALPTLSVASNNANLCFGQSATLTADGASTYTWNTGVTGSTISVSPTVTGMYTVTGTDNNGCIGSTTQNQQVHPLPAVSISGFSAAICSGESTTLSAGGALSYTWTSIGTGSIITVAPVSTTVFTVVGSDGNGCQNTSTFGITVNSLPVVNITSSDSVLCVGETATLSAGGAISYTWSTGGVSQEISVSPSSTSVYSVTAADINGCLNSSSFTQSVSVPVLTVSASKMVLCAGETSTLNVTGAVNYTWIPGGAGTVISVSPNAATIYTVTGVDVYNCTDSSTLGISVNALPTISVSASNLIFCAGESVTLTATGAATYSWSEGGTGGFIAVSPSVGTTYTVAGTDVNNCVNSSTLMLTVNPLPNVTAVSSNSSVCAGGSVTLTASGAVTYSWSAGGTGVTETITPLSSSTYSLSGTDINGCTNNATVSVNVNPLPNLNAQPGSTAVCLGQSATLAVNGALTYTWSTGGTGSVLTVSPNQSTTYTVTGTDANTCESFTTLSLTVNSLPVVNVISSNTALCVGQSATLTATGAVSYSWSSGGSGASTVVSPLVTSTYTVAGIDANACLNSATVGVLVNALPILNIVSSGTAICLGQSATLTAGGALNYSWSPGGAGPSIIVSPGLTSIYTVTGTDANACTDNAVVAIVVNALPNLSITASSTAICSGEAATLTANGALTYSWNPGGPNAGIIVSPGQSTTYTVTGTDGNNCQNETMFVLAVNALPVVSASATATLICAGETLTLTAGGAANYTWNPGGNGSNITVSPLISTSYSVVGTDSNNCSGSAVTSVTVNPLPEITISSSDTTICAGENVVLTASGAVTYTWNSTISGQSVSVTPITNTTYTVNGTDLNNCQNTVTFLQFVLGCTGNDEMHLNNTKVFLFPNPSSGKAILTGANEQGELRIFNSVGQLVSDPSDFKIISMDVTEIDLARYANGIYFLRSEREVWKLIKQE